MLVFISYSHIDKQATGEIAELLTRLEVNHYLDRKNIDWGGNITNEVHQALDKASHLILVLSPASLKSAWVAYETGHARAKGVTILPFLTHPSLELPSYLAGTNYISTLEHVEEFFSKSTQAIVRNSFRTAFLNSLAEGKDEAARNIAKACIPEEFNDYPELSKLFVESCIKNRCLYYPGMRFIEALGAGEVPTTGESASEFLVLYQKLFLTNNDSEIRAEQADAGNRRSAGA